MDIWKYYDITHKKHSDLNPMSKDKLNKLFLLLDLMPNSKVVDIGCGKGRVLLVAAEYGFVEVKGIEFSPLLCSIAEKNIDKYKQKTQSKTPFQVINADAANYQFEDDEDVFFLYNPFDEVILQKVLENITESLQRHNGKIWIIYANAVHRELIEKTMNVIKVEDFNIHNFKFVVYEIELASMKS